MEQQGDEGLKSGERAHTPGRGPIRAARLVLPAIVWAVVAIGASVYERTRPDLYEATVVVQDLPGPATTQRVALSELTAALVEREVLVSVREQVTEEKARRLVRNAARLVAEPDGRTTITVRHRQFVDARDLANGIATAYQGHHAEGSRHEASLAALAFLDTPSEVLDDARWLLLALQEQARKAGLASFGEVVADPGNEAEPGAATPRLREDEQFQRRLTKLRALRTELEDGSELLTAELRLFAYPPLPRLDRDPEGRGPNSYRAGFVLDAPEPLPRPRLLFALLGHGTGLLLAAVLYWLLGRSARTRREKAS